MVEPITIAFIGTSISTLASGAIWYKIGKLEEKLDLSSGHEGRCKNYDRKTQ